MKESRETKKQLQQKLFLPKTSSYRRDLIIAAVIILGGVFLVKNDPGKCKYSSMVEEPAVWTWMTPILLPL